MNQEVSSSDEPQILNSAELQAIIFDFDGTLVDSEPLWNDIYFEIFQEHCNVDVSYDLLWKNTGNVVDTTVENISDAYALGFSSRRILEMTDLINEEADRRILTLPLRPGARELFEWAETRGIAMAICTAATYDQINTYFGELEMIGYFAEVLSTALSKPDERKPHPFPYLQLLSKLDVKPEQTLVFEDSVPGIISSRAAGITTIAIHNPFIEDRVTEAKPMVQLTDFHQVLELLASSQK
ncbi:MAG TPA: HAD family phosphatase [Acidimicrobiia bacterium]|nr:HAD family phosphatase [Acidimicrobiia bacterium]